MRKTLEKNKGITLIALVVTIIVLLILAGISITMLSGQNGILNRATTATVESEMANVAESLQLYLGNKTIDNTLNYIDKDSLSTLKENGIIDKNNVVNTEKLFGQKTKYGNGEEEDIYKIIGDKIVYIDSNKKEASERDVNIASNDFITQWSVNANDVIVLPIVCKATGGAEDDNNFTVDWGDGTSEKVSGVPDERPSHTYTNSGEYNITIKGICKYFTLDSINDEFPDVATKLKRIVKWGEIGAEMYNFQEAVNLEGNIPSPQTSTFTNIDNDEFNWMFENCKKIESIPSDLFSNIPDDIVSFEGTFSHCESLKEIPEELFDNAQNVTSFRATFYHCNSLEAIPEGLFRNTTKVTTFEKTFYEDTKISSIPNNIFDNVPNITNLNLTFYHLEKVTSVPKLWERTTEGLNGSRCFAGCYSVDKTNISQDIIDVWFK